MTRHLDRTQPFGTISGPHNGAAFEQDGAYFNGAGEWLFEDRPPTPPKIEITEVVTVNEDGSRSVETVENEVVPEVADKRTALIAWLRGELDPAPPFLTVSGWGRSLSGKVLRTKADLVTWAVDSNLVTADQVKV